MRLIGLALCASLLLGGPAPVRAASREDDGLVVSRGRSTRAWDTGAGEAKIPRPMIRQDPGEWTPG